MYICVNFLNFSPQILFYWELLSVVQLFFNFTPISSQLKINPDYRAAILKVWCRFSQKIVCLSNRLRTVLGDVFSGSNELTFLVDTLLPSLEIFFMARFTDISTLFLHNLAFVERSSVICPFATGCMFEHWLLDFWQYQL